MDTATDLRIPAEEMLDDVELHTLNLRLDFAKLETALETAREKARQRVHERDTASVERRDLEIIRGRLDTAEKDAEHLREKLRACERDRDAVRHRLVEVTRQRDDAERKRAAVATTAQRYLAERNAAFGERDDARKQIIATEGLRKFIAHDSKVCRSAIDVLLYAAEQAKGSGLAIQRRNVARRLEKLEAALTGARDIWKQSRLFDAPDSGMAKQLRQAKDRESRHDDEEQGVRNLYTSAREELATLRIENEDRKLVNASLRQRNANVAKERDEAVAEVERLKEEIEKRDIEARRRAAENQ